MSHCACIFNDGALVESCKFHGARDAEITQLRASLNRVNDACLRAEQERDQLRAEVEQLKEKDGQEKNNLSRNP